MRSYARFNRGLVSQYHNWMIAMHYARITQVVYSKGVAAICRFYWETIACPRRSH